MSTRELLEAGARYLGCGRLDEAEHALGAALEQDPRDADARHLLGVAAYNRGSNSDAERHIRTAIALRPDVAAFHHNLGLALNALGDLGRAAGEFSEAARLGMPQSRAKRETTLAEIAFRQGRDADAERHCREALRWEPESAEALSNLGAALIRQGRLIEAESCCHKAAGLAPRNSGAWNNLGNVLLDQDRLAEAETVLRRGIETAGPAPDLLATLGHALWRGARLDEALACFDEVLSVRPLDSVVRVNRAQVLLKLGRFGPGWEEWEWRWKTGAVPRRTFRQPEWDGSRLDGRRILLWAEQGLGDAIQFVRYAESVRALGGIVVLECLQPVYPVFGTVAGIEKLVPFGAQLPEFDVQLPLLSLPRVLGTTLETIPGSCPYVAAAAAPAEFWRERLAASRQFRVGLVWAGNPNHREDRRRSIPAERLRPLLETPGVDFFALQKGPAAGSLSAVAGRHVAPVAGQCRTFADTAAIVANLDLIISVDTAVAHLAGALAKPVWILLPFAADWRWLSDRPDSPWYPTARLFRQRRPGDWVQVIEDVREELARRASENGKRCPR